MPITPETITLEPGGINLPTEQEAAEIRAALGCAAAGVENTAPTTQFLGSIPEKIAPDYFEIDLSQGLNIIGNLIADTVLKLTNAEIGQGGIIILGVHEDHFGEAFDVTFDELITDTHTADGHNVLTGSLTDFTVLPGANEYKFGTIGWFYDGFEYHLYVGNVYDYTNAISAEAP